MSTRAITLSRHISEEEHRHPGATGELSKLLAQIGFAAKILAREVGRAALVGKLGLVGERNPTGDAQKKLDVFANDTLVRAFAETGLVCGIVSEELETLKKVPCGDGGKYILCVDPVDGSSNLDVNGSVGTIFGIYRRAQTSQLDLEQELLRKGSEQIAAGYVMYSTSTILVYTCGHGVNGFTLDRDLGEFLLSHENISCPRRGHYYSANLGHFYEWPTQVREFIKYLTEPNPSSGRTYSLRYSGALVADLHRSLLEGGLYFYPPDKDHKTGKLRYLYECAPLGFVVEKAGGRASTGNQPILDIQPETIHQQVPLVIGSFEDVSLYEKFIAGEAVEKKTTA